MDDNNKINNKNKNTPLTMDEHLKKLYDLITHNQSSLTAKIDSSTAEVTKKLDAHKKEIKATPGKKFEEIETKISAAQSTANLALSHVNECLDLDRRR